MTKLERATFNTIHEDACNAGEAAVSAATIEPMDVTDGKTTWHIEDGVCGFAWVSVKGNTPFGRWGKETGVYKKGYPSGLHFWIHYYDQSLQKKEIFARAYAEVLKSHGIDAYAESRID